MKSDDTLKLRYNQRVGRLAQLVRAPLLHSGGRGFESPIAHRGTPRDGEFWFNEPNMVKWKGNLATPSMKIGIIFVSKKNEEERSTSCR
jgi:hypothetical protein